MNADADAHDAHESHMGTYVRVLVMLTVLTALEFAIAFAVAPDSETGVKPGLFVIGVTSLVLMAAWKAVLVGRVFMHLKYDPKLLTVIAVTPVVLAVPLVILGIWDGVAAPTFGG